MTDTKSKAGRPSFEPTAEQRRTVKALTAYGATQAEISRVIEIAPQTLRLHFWRELEVGGIEANAKVAQSLFNKALSDKPQSVTAAIFWLKARAGWTDQGPMPGAPMGKKDQAQADAATAGADSDWGDDLAFDDTPMQ